MKISANIELNPNALYSALSNVYNLISFQNNANNVQMTTETAKMLYKSTFDIYATCPNIISSILAFSFMFFLSKTLIKTCPNPKNPANNTAKIVVFFNFVYFFMILNSINMKIHDMAEPSSSIKMFFFLSMINAKTTPGNVACTILSPINASFLTTTTTPNEPSNSPKIATVTIVKMNK